MNQPTVPMSKSQEDSAALQSRGPRHWSAAKKSCIAGLALTILLGVALYWIYGTDTHHSSRGTIIWSERGRSLIPPTATDITLQQDMLDHYVTYKIADEDLSAFLNERFAEDGEPVDSFSQRSPANPAQIGKPIGRLGWVVTKDTVVYDHYTSNGAGSRYYHDPTTGQTYQESAYW